MFSINWFALPNHLGLNKISVYILSLYLHLLCLPKFKQRSQRLCRNDFSFPFIIIGFCSAWNNRNSCPIQLLYEKNTSNYLKLGGC